MECPTIYLIAYKCCIGYAKKGRAESSRTTNGVGSSLQHITLYVYAPNAFPAGEGGPKGRMKVGEQLRISDNLKQNAAAVVPHLSAPLRSAASFPRGSLGRSRAAKQEGRALRRVPWRL